MQAQTQEHLAINAFRVANSAASNNIMLAGVGVSYRIDSMHVAVPNGVVSVPVLEKQLGRVLTEFIASPTIASLRN